MSETERIVDQLRCAFEGDAWHGPALLEVLDGVSAEEAAAHPVAGVHGIWEIVLHLVATRRVVLRRLGGEAAVASAEEDWPLPDDTGDAAWSVTLRDLKQTHGELQQVISRLMRDSALDDPIVEGLSSVYRTLHGLIQHDLYHAGQMALLRKALQHTDGGT